MDKNQRLHAHLTYAYEHAPAVKALFDEAGLTPDDIQSTADLAKLPVTSKDMLIQQQQANPPFGGWNAVPVSDIDTIFLSPGPLYDPHDDATTENAGDILRQAGFGPDDVVINAFLYHMVPAGILFHEGLVQAGATVVPIGPGNIEVHLKVMQDLGATGYVGTPSFLAMILDKAAEMGLPKEAITIQKASFSAEPYPPSLRHKFENEYGMQTGQSYATADFGTIAYQLPGQQDFHLRDDLVVELADPQTGQPVPEGTPGEVVVTNFSRVYPLVRLGTGDMAVMVPGTGRLYGLVGRSGEAVKVRGMFVHPNQLRMAVPQIEGVQQWAAVVEREDSRDVLALHLTVSDEAEIDAEQVKQLVKQAVRVTVDAVHVVETVENAGQITDRRDWE